MKTYELDIRSRDILDKVFPPLKQKMLRVYYRMFTEFGVKMRPTRGLSSMEEQLKLWRQGRDEDGNIISMDDVVTYSPPGSSTHNYGAAVDSCFFGMDPFLEYMQKKDPTRATQLWIAFGAYAKGEGLEWGGDWQKLCDRVHCQLTYGVPIKGLQEEYKSKGIEGVYKYLEHVRCVLEK